MYIKSAQKSANYAFNMVLFCALELMLLTEFIPNSTTKSWSSGINYFKDAKLVLMQICPNYQHVLQKVGANKVP